MTTGSTRSMKIGLGYLWVGTGLGINRLDRSRPARSLTSNVERPTKKDRPIPTYWFLEDRRRGLLVRRSELSRPALDRQTGAVTSNSYIQPVHARGPRWQPVVRRAGRAWRGRIMAATSAYFLGRSRRAQTRSQPLKSTSSTRLRMVCCGSPPSGSAPIRPEDRSILRVHHSRGFARQCGPMHSRG